MPKSREMCRRLRAINEYTSPAIKSTPGKPITTPIARYALELADFKIAETAAAPSQRPLSVTNQTEPRWVRPY
jgi:hypothetical protein